MASNKSVTADDGWLEPAQREIIPQLRPLLAEVWPVTRLRALVDEGLPFDPEDFASATPDLYLPMASSRSLHESAVIAQEWGRSLCPPVLIDMNIAAAAILETRFADPDSQLISELRSGRTMVAWCASELPNHWGDRRSGATVVTDSGGADLVLSGSGGLVHGAVRADAILVAARDGHGTTQLLVPADAPGVSIEPWDSLDLTREVGVVRFDDVRVASETMIGPRGGAAEQLDHQANLALVLSTASTVGTMSVVFEQALNDARTRTAFGRKVGSFQAVKHQLVDASLMLETSRALSAKAAEVVAARASDAEEIVSMAKAYVGRAGIDVAHIAWQVLAGKAYMWDTDFHLYLRRITTGAAWYGGVNWHEQHVWQLRGPRPTESGRG